MSEGVLKGKLFCSIYKSRRKSGMYLYVDRQKGLKEVPEILMGQFGHAEHVTDMILNPERPLARADVEQVMSFASGGTGASRVAIACFSCQRLLPDNWRQRCHVFVLFVAVF